MSDKNQTDVMSFKEKLVYFLMGINAGMILILIYQTFLNTVR